MLLISGHWTSVRTISETLELTKSILYQTVMQELQMRKICGKFYHETYLAKRSDAKFPQPPRYGFNVLPPDRILFSRLISSFEGHRFDNLENTQKNVTRVLNRVSNEDFYGV